MNKQVATYIKKQIYSCELCEMEFIDYICKKRKFCGRKCSDDHHARNRKLRGGGYSAIHKWLENHYGKANKCENKLCDNTSGKFHWALKEGFAYKHDRENFNMLCVSCHKKQDITDTERERLRTLTLGAELTDNHKDKISASMVGKNKGSKNGMWKGGKHVKA